MTNDYKEIPEGYTPKYFLKEREEKKCQNCETVLSGRFCHNCGQENHEHKESLWHLISHFIEAFIHFDSKFFKTIIPLLFKPGFLTKEYNAGRQKRYFHPVSMYVFVSTLYFFLFFSFNHIENHEDAEKGHAKESHTNSSRKKDSVTGEHFQVNFNANMDSFYVDTNGGRFSSAEEYDSVQLALPKTARDSWIDSYIAHKLFKIYTKLNQSPSEFFIGIIEKFSHNLPKTLFILMPFFAFFLYLLYRKKFAYYVEHCIFVLHYNSAFFLANSFAFLTQLFDNKWVVTSIIIISVMMLFHLLFSMKNVYGETWMKTFGKFILLNILYGLASIVVLALNILFIFAML